MTAAVTNPESPTAPAAAARSELRVSGMTCNNCARKVTDTIQAVPGVQSVLVSIQTQRASVRWQAGVAADANELVRVVTAAGYETKLLAPVAAGEAGERPAWHLNLWVGAIVTTVLMVGEWVFKWGMTGWFAWTSFALASLVQIYCGAQF